MKILSPIAMCILTSISIVAEAQSSVTIYGLVDLGINKGNGGTATNPGGNGTSKAWQVKNATASRLGFRGNEDLGGGLSAQFHIEHRFTPDDGIGSTPFWAARSTVTLSSSTLGAVYLGRDYAPAFWPALKTDPFGFNGVGQVTSLGGYQATGGLRTNNTVGYRSPTFGGFKFQGAVAAGEGTVGRDVGALVEYSVAPLYAGLAIDKIAGGPAANDNNSIFNVGVSYDFRWIKPMAYYARTKTGTNGANSNSYAVVGAVAPVGSGAIKAAIARYDAAGSANTRTKFAVGYDHYLSKRTYLYADVSSVKQDARTNNRAFSLGITHSF